MTRSILFDVNRELSDFGPKLGLRTYFYVFTWNQNILKSWKARNFSRSNWKSGVNDIKSPIPANCSFRHNRPHLLWSLYMLGRPKKNKTVKIWSVSFFYVVEISQIVQKMPKVHPNENKEIFYLRMKDSSGFIKIIRIILFLLLISIREKRNRRRRCHEIRIFILGWLAQYFSRK